MRRNTGLGNVLVASALTVVASALTMAVSILIYLIYLIVVLLCLALAIYIVIKILIFFGLLAPTILGFALL